MGTQQNGVEFYNSPDNEAIIIHDSEFPDRALSQSDIQLVNDILDNIEERYTPDTINSLKEIYSPFQRNRLFFRFKMANRFCKCNFGALDMLHKDIDRHGFWHLEEVACPMRGECHYEGKICKPVANHRLTEREQEVVKYIAQGLSSQEIADILFLSIATINHHRENAKIKLGLHSVTQLASYYYRYLNT